MHEAAGQDQARILVVEDDPDFAELLRSELCTEGHVVSVARSVAAAQELLRDDPDVSLIISDVQLPGGSGVELLWNEREGSARVPVLMMSAFPSPELRSLAKAAGASFLEKPFSLAHLHAIVFCILMKRISDRPGPITVIT